MMCLFWSFYTSWWFVAIDFDSCGLCRSKTGTVLSHRLHQAIACFRTRENRKKAHYVPLGSPAHFRTQPLPVMCLIVLHMYVTFSNVLWLMPWQKDHWQLCIGSASKVDHRLKTCAELLLMTNVYCLHIYDPYQCSSGPIFVHTCSHIHHGWGAHPAVVSKQEACLVSTKRKKNPRLLNFPLPRDLKSMVQLLSCTPNQVPHITRLIILIWSFWWIAAMIGLWLM